MKLKKLNLSLILMLVGLFLITSMVTVAEENQYIDENIPDSWYNAPKTASERGISDFSQSPMLDERVDKGELPSVKKRLPKDPPAIVPYNEIGEYGGTANVWGTTLDRFLLTGANYLGHGNANLGRATPDGSKVVPFLAKDWEYSDNYKTLILHLREGLKWSDGHPFTSEDYMFWWDHVANNSDLTPVPPEQWQPVSLLEVNAPDEYTVEFHFDKPNPTRHQEFHIWTFWGLNSPKHYMKQFHPEFVEKEKLMEKAEAADFDLWYEYYEYRNSRFNPERGVRPSLMPYIAVERSETYLLAERNPYFPFVDTEGNQLPYIDKIRLNLANDDEMIAAKATTGEATIAGIKFSADQIPMFKQNEEKGNYKTYIYKAGRGSAVTIFPNLTIDDPELKEIFHDERFRQALSLSIDRGNINRKIYLDQGTPRQSTVIPTAEYFEPEFAESYIEYDPETAKELLNEVGMKDTNGDGFRERPSGDTFKPTIITTGSDKLKVLEMIRSNFNEIGINVDIKPISRELRVQRYLGNNWTMGAWHTGRASEILFPRNPRIVAPVGNIYDCPWGAYHTWYSSGGEEGEEPPAEIKKLIGLVEDLRRATDEKERLNAGKKLLEIQSEKLWGIGTVGLIPRPLILSKNLKNVPRTGLMSDDLQRLAPFYPSQFYLEK